MFQESYFCSDMMPKGDTALAAWGCCAPGTGSGPWLACWVGRAECCMESIGTEMGMVGRATTTMGAMRNSPYDWAPGGGQSFPVIREVGAGSLLHLSEVQFAFHSKFIFDGCLPTSIWFKCRSVSMTSTWALLLVAQWSRSVAHTWHVLPQQECHGLKDSSVCKVSAITCISPDLWTDVISFMRPVIFGEEKKRQKTPDKLVDTQVFPQDSENSSSIFQTKHKLKLITLCWTQLC